VAVFDVSFQDIGDRLYPAMGVPRKAFDILIGIGIAEIIQQQERVKEGNFAVSKNPPEMDTCALDRGFAFKNFPNLSVSCHWRPPSCKINSINNIADITGK